MGLAGFRVLGFRVSVRAWSLEIIVFRVRIQVWGLWGVGFGFRVKKHQP